MIGPCKLFTAKLFTAVVIAVSVAGCLTGCFDKTAESFDLNGTTMGTTWQVTVVDPPKNVASAAIDTQIQSELGRMNALMSTYDPESQISQFNAQKSTDWIEVDNDMVTLIAEAKRISKDTSSAYDITLGSVSQLWGFGPEGTEKPTDAIPEMDDILLHLNNIGYQLLVVNSQQQKLRKLTPDLVVDLSSIGKGYAVDKLGELLEASGVTRYLVEIGGEIRTRGFNQEGERWKVGIEWPTAGSSNPRSGVSLENSHVATSGDYRNYKELNGQRYSHLLDGRTGFPISHNLASVTLLHGSTMLADAWATAFMVLGYEDSLAIATSKGLAASFTVKDDSGFVVHTTPAFEAYTYLAD